MAISVCWSPTGSRGGILPQETGVSVVRPYSFRNLDVCFFFVFLLLFFNCMFYQLLRVQHSCSSSQSWGSVLPSIVETREFPGLPPSLFE